MRITLKPILGLGLVAGLAALATVPAQADPVTYLFTGIASGDVNGVAFSNKLIDLTASGDTSSVGIFAPGVYVNEVGNIGVLLFGVPGDIGSSTNTFTVFDNQNTKIAGLDDDAAFADVFDVGAPQFASYDLKSGIGPLFTTYEPQFNFPLSTSFGTITFSSVRDTTFTAIVSPVPEASSVVSLGLLLALGMGGVVVASRKRKSLSL